MKNWSYRKRFGVAISKVTSRLVQLAFYVVIAYVVWKVFDYLRELARKS